MKRLAALGLALMLALAVCPPALASREENSIVYPLDAEPERVDSIGTGDAAGFQLLQHLYTGLLTLDQNGAPAPGVARAYEVSGDGLRYTFTLREDARWWDGAPVTAHDFYYAWTELLDPENACGAARMACCIKNAGAYGSGQAPKEALGLRAADDLTFEVTLEYPEPWFPYLITFGAFMPRRQDFAERYGEDYGTSVPKIMGNGAYKIAEWQHGERIVMVKNPQYFDRDSVAIEKLVGLTAADDAYAMFERGELDVAGLNETTGLLAEQGGYQVLQYSDGSVCFLQMNCKSGPAANLNIRRALGLSLNRQSLVNNVLRDHSRPALTFTNGNQGEGGKAFSERIAVDYQDADGEKARACWEKGLEELGMTADEAERALVLTAGDSDWAKAAAASFQKDWKSALGVEIQTEHLSMEDQAQRMKDGEYVLAFSEWKPDSPNPAAFLESMRGGGQHTGWHSAEYDGMLDAAGAEIDLERRMDRLAGAESLLISEMPVAPLYFRMRDYALADGLQGVRRSAFQGYCFRWADWAE